MTNLAIFNFESHEIRFVGTADSPWWVAADVCKVLDIQNIRQNVAKLDEDEKGVCTIDTPGGKQEVITINESGLYSLVLTSRKTQAKRFKKWLTSEVIPSIRKAGTYSVNAATSLAMRSHSREYLRIALPCSVPDSIPSILKQSIESAKTSEGLPLVLFDPNREKSSLTVKLFLSVSRQLRLFV